MPASNGLAAAERPDLTFKSALLAVGVSVMLVPGLVLKWGVYGAAYGFLAGNIVGTLARWVSFSALLRRRWREKGQDLAQTVALGSTAETHVANVRQVLHGFTQDPEATAWVIEPLNEGIQASLFSVHRKDGQLIGKSSSTVAVKLYKPTAQLDSAMVRRQFDALAQFHAKLHGRTMHGWKICTPVPLFRSESPRALVMTIVPGESLNSLLATADAVKPETLESITHAVVAALERLWLIEGQLHGDLNFDNILCDEATRTLALIDAGVIDKAVLCEEVSRQWYPASRDLAYLLFDTTVSLKKILGNPAARRRQQGLLERLLRVFLKRIGSAGAQQSLLDEVEACVQAQFERLQVLWSPRGLWRLFLRQTASRRIERILERLRPDAEIGRMRDEG
jgi:tRNA A-37 threonylcarbamoyl transferase component Bud32